MESLKIYKIVSVCILTTNLWYICNSYSFDKEMASVSLIATVHFKLVVMRKREKLKYTEDHFNRNLELQDEVPIASVIVACFCLFKLFPILHDNEPEIHCN